MIHKEERSRKASQNRHEKHAKIAVLSKYRNTIAEQRNGNQRKMQPKSRDENGRVQVKINIG